MNKLLILTTLIVMLSTNSMHGMNAQSDSYQRTIPPECLRPDRDNPDKLLCQDKYGKVTTQYLSSLSSDNIPKTTPVSALTKRHIAELFKEELPKIPSNPAFKKAMSEKVAPTYGAASAFAGTRENRLTSRRVDHDSMVTALTKSIKTLPHNASFEEIFQHCLAAIKKMDIDVDAYYRDYHGHEESFLTIIRTFGSQHGIIVNEQNGAISFAQNTKNNKAN